MLNKNNLNNKDLKHMEIRIRDSRRLSTANAIPRRRHLAIPLPRSSQEREVEETARVRGKRERDDDREPLRKRRGSRSHSTEEEEEETVGNEQDGHVFDQNNNNRSSRTFRRTPPPPRHPSKGSIAREIIGVTVPRKPRSAYMKTTWTRRDIEFEIAELLFGMQTLKNHDSEKKKVEDHSASTIAPEEAKLSLESAKASPLRNADNASGHGIGSWEASKEDNEEHSLNSRPEARSESPSCSQSKYDAAKQDGSASIGEDNLSRGEDGVKVEDEAERLVTQATKKDIEEAKMDPFKDEMDILKLDLEKPNKLNEAGSNKKLEEERPTISTTGQSSSVSLSTVIPERPSSVCLPLRTVVKVEKTSGSPTVPTQHVNFILSQPGAKRCATHRYIARSILLHQQCAKMNPLLPSDVGPSSLCVTKPGNINHMPSTESMVVGKQSKKHSPSVNQNSASDSLVAINNSAPSNPVDLMKRKQLVLQQAPHPGSTGNLVDGPAFLFPPGQHQASVTTTTVQGGGVNSTGSGSSSDKYHSAAAGPLGTSSTLPAVAAATAMSFGYPNFAANDTPYATMVQNSGYPFPFSTPLGASAAIRGASLAQATPMLSGPLYSSQMFHPLQHPQQHPHPQAMVQPSYLNASISSVSSSSSHKQSQGTQVNSNSVLTSPAMQLQQSQKQHASLSNPHKHEAGMGGENTPSVAGGTAYSQKNVFRQNYTIPVQPPNITFRLAGTSDGVGAKGGDFGDKQQQPQASKGGVERIPSQQFAISFPAFNGTSTIPSNLNFSSMLQNPLIFQGLPDIAWQRYQAACASLTAQQKIYSITEGKSGGNSSHQDDEKKATSGKPSTNGPTTLVFDNPSKNLNFVSSPVNRNWPSHSITSTTTSLPLSSNASNSQQPPQLLHLQQQHGMLQQQPAMATQYKTSSTNAASATKFVNSPSAFPQTLNHFKSSNPASQSKNLGRTLDTQVHNTSITTTTATTLKSFSQEQGRVMQGHTQISFGGNYIASLPPQGQQLLNNNQPFGSSVAGNPPNGGNLKTNSQGSKLVPSVNTSQMQQTENCSAGSGQKTSPVCGRNVPTIFSSFPPSHLSELKCTTLLPSLQ